MITLSAKIYIDHNSVIEVNNKNMVSLERTISDREDFKLPSWGIISNSGKISFYDPHETILNLVRQDKINEQTKVEFFINNTLTKNIEKIGTYYIFNIEYDNDQKLVKADVKDGMEELQDIKIPQIEVHSLKNFYEILYEIIFYSNVTTDAIIDINTKELLELPKGTFFYYDGNNAWNLLNDFALSSMLHIYKNENGKTIIKYSM